MTISHPGTHTSPSIERVVECVRMAAERGEPLRIEGAGSWLDAGWPVGESRPFSLAEMTGIVDYTPGDLTLTARAGTSLDEIARTTAAERQWLALDPFGPSTSTLGATIATASAGPLAHAFGTPRDNVLGLQVVTGDGQVVNTGGRVVKNVAGFDLTRLFTGSWGTLAIITEATVRLRALPELEESWVLRVSEEADALESLFSRLRFAPLEAAAIELVSAPMASRLAIDTGGLAALLLRLGGNEGNVRSQRGFLSRLSDSAAPTPQVEVWRLLRECEPDRAAVARFSAPASRMAGTWAAAREAGGDSPEALVHATIDRGVARCIVPADDDEAVERLLRASTHFDGTVIFERLPGSAWERVARLPTSDRLSRGIKQRFDPMNVLNPGILGERP